MQKIAIADALDAIERNVRAFIVIAGEKAGYIQVSIDTYTGTASIRHSKDTYTQCINCEILMPAMAAQTFIAKDELDRWIGYFIHELCHALYTDEMAWRQACIEGIQNIVNGLEDPRIEKRFNSSGVASNSRELLESLLAWCVSETPAKTDPNAIESLAWNLALVGRIEVCGYALPEAAAYIARFSPAMRATVYGVMPALAAAQNTSDVLAIARGLQSALKAGTKTNPGQQGQQGQSDGGKPEGQQGQSDGQPEGQPEGQSDGQSDGGKPEGQSDGQSDGGKPEGQSDGQSGAQGQPEGQSDGQSGKGNGQSGGKRGDELQGDVTQCAPVDINPVSKERNETGKAMARNGTANGEASVIDAIRRGQKTTGKALKTVAEASRQNVNLVAESMVAAKLRAQVARVLKSEENESWDRGRASGRLDRFAIARIGAGQTENVYAKRNIAGGYETEIDVLVDASGSMCGAPMRAATVLSYVIAQAAQQVGVKCTVAMFTSDFHLPRVVKAANESLTAKGIAKRFSTMASGTQGSTPLTEAIVISAARLAARAPQKRKMVFVVSDGGCDNGPEGVRKACDYAERLGVETVALCIDIPPHNGFRHAARCSSSNIASAGLGVLVRALSREA